MNSYIYNNYYILFYLYKKLVNKNYIYNNNKLLNYDENLFNDFYIIDPNKNYKIKFINSEIELKILN
jgi:hypothetical protein